MKKIKAFCLFLGFVTILSGFALPARAQSQNQAVVSGCYSVEAALTLSDEGKLVETAKAVILYELNSDTMVYTYNPDERIYPASMVKLMTALVALENGNLADRVVVTKRALSNVEIGSVSAGLEAGEELSLEDLLYCMMVASANDAAAVIAEHVGGTQETFVKMMNRKATDLGCNGTNYTNAHGLHDEQNYTTARDICRLLDVALDIPEFKTLFCAKSYTVPATNKSEERKVVTSNHMMSRETLKNHYDERVTGGKTGATDEAGRCLAATAEGNGMELLTIVMGAEATYVDEDKTIINTFGSFEETAQLLDYAMKNYQCMQVFSVNQTISQHSVENGANAVVTRPANSAYTVLPKEESGERLTWIYGASADSLTAPIQEGQVISTVQVWYGAKCLAQTDLVAANAVQVWQTPEQPEPPEQPEDNTWKIVAVIGGAVLGIGALLAIVFGIRNGIRRAAVNLRRRRRRVGRRRSR